MKIIDLEVNNYENEDRIRNDKKKRIDNRIFKNRATQIKNGAIPVKSIEKGVEANKLKDARVDINTNEYKAFVYQHKSENEGNINEIGVKTNELKVFDNYHESLDIEEAEITHDVNGSKHEEDFRKSADEN
ncbi:15445_t:CDS:1, partial [Racocetra persica]